MGGEQSRLNQQHELYKVGVTAEIVSNNGIFNISNVTGFATCTIVTPRLSQHDDFDRTVTFCFRPNYTK